MPIKTALKKPNKPNKKVGTATRCPPCNSEIETLLVPGIEILAGVGGLRLAHVFVARAAMRPPAAPRKAIAVAISISIAATAITLIAASTAIDLRL